MGKGRRYAGEVRMKDLMIYIHPDKCFMDDHVPVAKIQLENTLRHWKKEDVLIVTNFPYIHAGFESIVVPDSLFCQHRRRASKINVICYLLKEKILNEMCWFHDWDAFQLEELPENIIGDKVAGFTDYGFNSYWNTGSFFFIPEAVDVFLLIKKVMYDWQCNEEQALQIISTRNLNNANDRYVRLDSTYNLGGNRMVKEVYEKAEKPIKVIHFHPGYGLQFENVKALLPEHLLALFLKYGYK